MFPALVGALYVPVAIWLGMAVGLVVAYRRSTPPVVLRLAVAFLALWALLATTTAVWVLAHGGWPAVVALARSPDRLFQPGAWHLWVAGAVGSFTVFAGAFGLNQLVGRGFLRLLRTHPLPWPRGLLVPAVTTTLLAFPSPTPEAFSFALVRRGPGLRVHRHEYILLSSGLRERLATDEVEAAIAHELGHLRDLDGRYLTFLRTLARMMRWDPVIGYLTSCLTRREEFRADAEAARITGQPMALARALYKAAAFPVPAVAPLGVVTFLSGRGRRARSDTVDRIQRLVELAESGMFPEAPRGRR